MKSIRLSYNIMLLNQTGDTTTVSKDFSFDDAERDTFPSPMMSAALFAGLLLPDNFDEVSASGDVTCSVQVAAICDGACETIKLSDTVSSTIDAMVLLYSALDLAVEKLLPDTSGRVSA